jgi:hypothetical protein
MSEDEKCPACGEWRVGTLIENGWRDEQDYCVCGYDDGDDDESDL